MSRTPSPGPGAEPFPPEVARALSAAGAARPPGAPRTRHLEGDGTPSFVNRLLLESSPYLRQHAHNPVDWRPWGDEAFDAAARLGRPVLLSVGYSTCHWCHVMEEESFEDLEIARTLNELYVPVKVDREERPDVDAVYMAAVQALTGQGGWPMTVFLTPDRRPFYAGTYFPARDGDRGARMGFLTLLRRLRQVVDDDPEAVEGQARGLAEHLEQALAPDMGGDLPDASVLERVAAHWTGRYDATWGGVRGAPKFPSSLPVRFLLAEHQRTGDERLLEVATHTLRSMAAGGLRDHVGGGFHRYSVDSRWLVPHFEKMLYDNALLALDYTEAWRVTGEPAFEEVAREVLAYVAREMTTPEGGFWSATDADSPVPGTDRSEEGWFFTWTPDEIRHVLDPEHADAAIAWWHVEEGGNFEGRSILHTPRAADVVAAELGVSPERLRALVDEAREALYAARASRPPPPLDDKVLAAWNGLMISSFARAAVTFGDPSYAQAARRAAAFVLDRLCVDGRLRRSFKDGQARHDAVLEDHAFVVAGLLDLFEATSERRWLDAAVELDDIVERHFADPRGGWFRTPDDGEALLAREKPDYDGAEPTGASFHVRSLLRLAALTTDDRYRQRADAALRAHAARIAQGALSHMLLALDWRLDRPKEIAVVTRGGPGEAAPFLAALARHAPRNHVLVVVAEGQLAGLVDRVPWLGGKVAREGRPTAYVCEQGLCRVPATDVSEFRAQLG